MKKTKDKITRYIDGDFIIEIVESETEFDAWIGHRNYGVFIEMFGVPKKQLENTFTYAEFRDMVAADLDRHKSIYREEYMN